MTAVPAAPTSIRAAARPRTARSWWPAIALLAGLARMVAAADPTLTIDAASTLVTLQRTFSEVPLRGYGTVSGRLWNGGSAGTVLEIRCASAARAQLTQAKYLSDLQLLPGVEAGTLSMGGPRWGAAALSLHQVKDQGVVMALRAGSTLFIAAAAERMGLQQLLAGAFAGSAAGVATAAEVGVPMWLDRFDRHGFRFYYAPFTVPPAERMADGAKPATYDFTRDFAFAKDSGAGLVLWSTQSMQGASEGVTNANWWGWVERWAEPLGLPIGINLSAYNYDLPNWVANRFRSQLAQPMPQYLGDSMSIAGGRGTGGKVGELAWGATAARDAMFGSLQQVVRRFAKEPNVISWLEPHGEFYQGGDAFMGYGPAVDATFREYLQGRYHAGLRAQCGLADQAARDRCGHRARARGVAGTGMAMPWTSPAAGGWGIRRMRRMRPGSARPSTTAPGRR